MSRNFMSFQLSRLFDSSPSAVANVYGAPDYPSISGRVEFFQTRGGVVIVTYITGLPWLPGKCEPNILGFHIHEGSACTGTPENPFADTGMHYNPGDCPHPAHAGDLPPLFVSRGYAFSAFLTSRFFVSDIIGKSVVIHSGIDDFTTQPSGNAGNKIACGIISSTDNKS